MDHFKNACALHTARACHRYLMSNADGRWDGAEKAHRHIELCTFYVCVVTGYDDPDTVRHDYEDLYKGVHDHTQQLTDNLDEVIGFPLKGRPDYNKLAPLFFEHFHRLAMEYLTPERVKASMDAVKS